MAAIALLTACAAAPTARDACVQRALLADICIDTAELADWQFIDERTLLLWDRQGTERHVVHLSRSIALLLFAEEIDVLDGDLDGLICPCGKDEIGVEALPGSSTRISSIERLGEKPTARLAEFVGARQASRPACRAVSCPRVRQARSCSFER